MQPAVTGRPSQAKDAGFTLVELVVAVLVLSIALVGLLRLMDTSRATIGGEIGRTIALAVAQNRAAELHLPRALQTNRGDTVRMGGQQWAIEEERKPTRGGFDEIRIRVTSVPGGQSSAQIVAYLPAGGTP